jgi:Flp pilus assembly protein TadG
VHVNRLLRDERGGILALSAFMMVLFLVLTALVVDVGNWYTHKRQLQNKADAGALAAGYEYLTQLKNCASPATAGAAATAISNVAKRYAGTGDAAVPGLKFNQTVNATGNLIVRINAASPTDNDGTDGGDPCTVHATGDAYSPSGAIWTDVKVRETNVGTLFGGFGLDLLSATAQARVELKQLIGLKAGGLPFIHETGDYVDCVWAQFVDASDSSNAVTVVNGSNPVLLTPDPNTPRRYTADVDGITFPNGDDDVAVYYWMGIKTGGTCNFSTTSKSRFAGTGPLDKFGNPAKIVPIDWINVFDDDLGGGQAPPRLHHFILSPGSCGSTRVGYIQAASACTVAFSVQVDHGADPAPSKVTVSSSNPAISPIDATPSSSAGTKTTYTGAILLDPTAVSGKATVTQDYTQVGEHLLKVSWTMTSGRLTSSNGSKLITPNRQCTTSNPCVCTTSNPCHDEFDSEIAGNWQHQTYVADPILSSPLSYAELLSGGAPLQNSYAADSGGTGPFKIVLTNEGVDQKHVVMIRSSVQGTGNLTLAVKCGWKSNSAEELEDAVIGGCPVPMTVNQRGDSCSPEPPLASGAWDCVEATPGNKTGKVSSGMHERFATPCTPNHWVNGSSPADLNPEDPRFAYIFLTSFGRVATGSGWYPIKAFLRVYITGADGMGCPGDDPPPRGFSNKGSEVWGHLVDIITLDDDVVPGDSVCNLSLAVLNCKPTLVR